MSAAILGADAAPFDFLSIECSNPAILSARRVGALGLRGQCCYDQGHMLSYHHILPGSSIPACFADSR